MNVVLPQTAWLLALLGACGEGIDRLGALTVYDALRDTSVDDTEWVRNQLLGYGDGDGNGYGCGDDGYGYGDGDGRGYGGDGSGGSGFGSGFSDGDEGDGFGFGGGGFGRGGFGGGNGDGNGSGSDGWEIVHNGKRWDRNAALVLLAELIYLSDLNDYA